MHATSHTSSLQSFGACPEIQTAALFGYLGTLLPHLPTDRAREDETEQVRGHIPK